MDDKNTKQLDNANREQQATPPHGDKLWPEQTEKTPPEDTRVPKSIPSDEPHKHGRELA
jgi:hypothetical protein